MIVGICQQDVNVTRHNHQGPPKPDEKSRMRQDIVDLQAQLAIVDGDRARAISDADALEKALGQAKGEHAALQREFSRACRRSRAQGLTIMGLIVVVAYILVFLAMSA